MKRFGSKVNNFWEPGYEPESDKTAFKPKDVDKECFIFVDESQRTQNGDKKWGHMENTELCPLFRLSDIKYPIGTLKCPIIRIPTVKLKIPGKALLKSESRTSVTFKL